MQKHFFFLLVPVTVPIPALLPDSIPLWDPIALGLKTSSCPAKVTAATVSSSYFSKKSFLMHFLQEMVLGHPSLSERAGTEWE